MSFAETFPIQYGIPLPPDKGHRRVYDFAGMEIGGSFAVPIGDEDQLVVRRRVSTAACNYGKRHGCRFSVRALTENGGTVIRCWRVA